MRGKSCDSPPERADHPARLERIKLVGRNADGAACGTDAVGDEFASLDGPVERGFVNVEPFRRLGNLVWRPLGTFLGLGLASVEPAGDESACDLQHGRRYVQVF